MGTMQFYDIQTGLFSKTISVLHIMVQLNNIASKVIVFGCKVSLIRPTPSRGVRGGWGNSYSMLLPQFLVSFISMNMKIR